jgi:hypothetical protein
MEGCGDSSLDLKTVVSDRDLDLASLGGSGFQENNKNY